MTTWALLASNRPKRVLLLLLLALPVLAMVGGGVEDRLSVGGFLDPDTESSRVADILEDEFGTGNYGFVLVFVPRNEWVYSESNVVEGRRISDAIAAEPGVVEVASFYNLPPPPPPAISPLRDGSGDHAVLGAVLAGDENEQRRTAEHLQATYAGPNDTFELYATGAVEVSRVAAERAEQDLTRAELLAAPFTLIGLLLVFRGWRAALIPLVVALFAVLASFVVLTVLVSFVEISVFARTLVTALGLGLAIDYSLLLVARFREERGGGRDVADAIRRTLRTAGRTVVFSAATVGSSLLGLLVFDVLYLRSFALAGLAVVSTTAVAAIVVATPLLAWGGPYLGETDPSGSSFWGRQARRVMRRPVGWLVAAVVVLGVLGLPFLRFSPGRVDDRVLPEDDPARIGAELIRENLSPPDVNPVHVVVRGGDAEDDEQLHEFSKELLAIPGVARVDSRLGFVRPESFTPPNQLNGHFRPDDAGHGTWFNLVSVHDPEGADELVAALRGYDSSLGDLLVGGTNATITDTVDSVTGRLPWALAVIAAVTVVLLFFMTGSVVIPIKALALNLLSLTATFGALVWVFQDGNLGGWLGITATGEIDVFTPILMFCIAFGLSMDYEVFLLARIKEEYDLCGDNAIAVAEGIGHTGGIVTAAAVLLAIVFAAISTSSVAIVKMFGLGLTLAVLTDAFVVRATLTPALMKLAGRWNWWAPRAVRRFHLRYGVWETGGV